MNINPIITLTEKQGIFNYSWQLNGNWKAYTLNIKSNQIAITQSKNIHSGFIKYDLTCDKNPLEINLHHVKAVIKTENLENYRKRSSITITTAGNVPRFCWIQLLDDLSDVALQLDQLILSIVQQMKGYNERSWKIEPTIRTMGWRETKVWTISLQDEISQLPILNNARSIKFFLSGFTKIDEGNNVVTMKPLYQTKISNILW